MPPPGLWGTPSIHTSFAENRSALVEVVCHVEVNQLEPQSGFRELSDENIVWLEVPMADVVLVQVSDCFH